MKKNAIFAQVKQFFNLSFLLKKTEYEIFIAFPPSLFLCLWYA